MAAASNAPGYPTAAGTIELREAIVQWGTRTLGATDLTVANVAPLVGSKEFVAWLPIVLGLDSLSTIAIPELAYPTYAVGALMAKSRFVTYTTPETIPVNSDVIWVNSPSNPTGEVLSPDTLRQIISRARAIGAVVVSDECYFELGWTAQPVSVLHPDVCGGDYDSVIAVHSLSKRSNLAGYRSGSLLGDAQLIDSIVSLRKHAGMLMPTPIQMASIAALGDDAHVREQRDLYAKRREILHTAFADAGFTIEHSEAGLYLWMTRGEACMETVTWLAKRGILVAPGDFYGPAGAQYVRAAMTATDERVAQVAARLQSA